jgi:hypothetical protein
MNLHQLRIFVIRPTLNRISLGSPAAENLIVGTGLVESRYEYVDQVTNANPDILGPAVGFFQMEKATHDWLYGVFRNKLAPLIASWPPPFEQMATNVAYAVGMCRMRYFVDPKPLPEADDIPALAAYWKRIYNTELGKGDPAEFVRRYRAAHKE